MKKLKQLLCIVAGNRKQTCFEMLL